MRGRAVLVGVVLLATACSNDGGDDPAPAAVRFAMRPALEVAMLGDGCADLGGLTPADGADDPAATVVLPAVGEPERCYRLGPVPTEGDAVLAGAILEEPEAVENQGQWMVATGIVGAAAPALDAVAAACFQLEPAVCPTGQLAIVLDGVVQSAPPVEMPSIRTAGIAIDGGFTEAEARAVAARLEGG